ncbi:TPA: hypothetical protein ACTXXA_003610 [Legionella anisa]
MSAEKNRVRVMTLIGKIKAAAESLAEMGFTVESSEESIQNIANNLKRESDWDEKVKKYQKFSIPQTQHKDHFHECAKKILISNTTSNNRQLFEKILIRGTKNSSTHAFEKATRQYSEVLKLLLQCQLDMAEALLKPDHTENYSFNYWIKLLEFQFEAIDNEVNDFKEKVQNVSVKLADTQVKTLKGEPVNLKNSISEIATHYEQVYDQSYGESKFWRLIKKIFQKSDRDKEIKFLNAVSANKECNELIRAQAVALVHNKILASEMFGKGSQLLLLLKRLLENSDQVEKADQENLIQFLESNEDIKKMMPNSLKEYFEANQREYNLRID